MIHQEISPDLIISVVCNALEIEPALLRSRCRTFKLSRARMVCYRLLRDCTKLSLMETAGLFNRHHSTVIYGLKACRDMYETSREFRRLYKDILTELQMKAERSRV